jgi:DtxR family Mn-dependent transcriptional regulator
MPSSTVENYLKHIYLQQQEQEDSLVPMGSLASTMGVAPGTATSMVKALAEAGLIEYEPRNGTRLTDNGKRLALNVLRRHRLVEQFLVQILGLDWSEVHEEAEELEHAVSDKVLEKIDTLLGRPRVDPHGDPIPSSKGTVEQSRLLSLASCGPSKTMRVARVLDQNPGFLKFIDGCGLTPGTSLTVESRSDDADTIMIQTESGTPVTIGSAAAEKILVETV